jgi:hypothetical protein
LTDRVTRSPVVFVIAPDEVSVTVLPSRAHETWRTGTSARMTVAVHAALTELHVELSRCSLRTQEVLARLCERESVPSVKDLIAHCSSRRSFYRSWQADIGETPESFLARVRRVPLRATAVQSAQPEFSRALRLPSRA